MLTYFREALIAAHDADSVPAQLDVLVSIAEFLYEEGDRERAVEILALACCYPMHQDTRELADNLYDYLATLVCPRILDDAVALADELTLEDMVLEVISEIEPEE